MNLKHQFATTRFRSRSSFVFSVRWALSLILFAVGCVQTEGVALQPANVPTTTLSDVATPAATVITRITTTPMPQPTETTTPTETATAQPATVQPTPAQTPVDTAVNWAGQFLIYYDGDDIYRFNLETETRQLIVPIFNQGIVWMSHAAPALNGQEVVYWYVEGEWFIVKAVNTITGQDRPLLTIDDDEFTAVRGSWLGQGHFFELAIWGEDENGVPLVKQWDLFDILNDAVVGFADNDPGLKICYALAISPHSNHVATWCSFEGQFDEEGNYVTQGGYFVIEANGEYWTTTTSPDQVLVETFGIEQKHNWSPKEDYVLVPRGSNATLIDVDNSQIDDLFEGNDIYLNAYDAQFSPDGRFLSYEYDVCEFDNFCQRILDLETRAVVWDSSGLFESPAHFFTWSPDGRYFVLRLSNGDYNIIETQNFSVVKSITKDTLLNAVEVIWLSQANN